MRAVRVKLCGLTRPEDIRAAVALRVDYLGFVFAPGSARTLRLEHAAAMLAAADTGGCARVGVFRDQPARVVNECVERCRLDLAQLHGHEPRDFPGAIRVPVVRVLRVRAAEPGSDPTSGDRPAAARLVHEAEIRGPRIGAELPLEPNVVAYLVDAACALDHSGGLGAEPEPGALRALLGALPGDARVFLAGGLTPANVADRVRTYRPWAVDVSSGIESAPGRKDPRLMAAFVAAVEGAT